jgi:hypothetical protein
LPPTAFERVGGTEHGELKFNCKLCEMKIWEKDAAFEMGEED